MYPAYSAPVPQRSSLSINAHTKYSTANEADQYALSPINEFCQTNFAAPSLEPFPHHDDEDQDLSEDNNLTVDLYAKNESKPATFEDDILFQHPQNPLSDSHLMRSTKDTNLQYFDQDTVAPSLVVPNSRYIQHDNLCGDLDPNRCLTEELKDIFVSLMQED
jgi:hypothetical protein